MEARHSQANGYTLIRERVCRAASHFFPRIDARSRSASLWIRGRCSNDGARSGVFINKYMAVELCLQPFFIFYSTILVKLLIISMLYEITPGNICFSKIQAVPIFRQRRLGPPSVIWGVLFLVTLEASS